MKHLHEALRDLQDPSLGQNLVDLGFVRELRQAAGGRVVVELTLPTPHHPQIDRIVQSVRDALLAQPDVAGVDVRLAWEPPWSPYHVAAPLRAALGLPDREPPGPPARSSRLGWPARLLAFLRRRRPRP